MPIRKVIFCPIGWLGFPFLYSPWSQDKLALGPSIFLLTAPRRREEEEEGGSHRRKEKEEKEPFALACLKHASNALVYVQQQDVE